MKSIGAMELFSAMRHISGDIHRRIKEIVLDTPLKGYHVIYLVRLMEGGPQTAKELSLALGADKGHTSRVLSDLLSLGFIEKEGEARMAKLSLTERGWELAQMASKSFAEIESKVAKAVSQEDFQAFARVLHSIREALEAGRSHDNGHGHVHGRRDDGERPCGGRGE